MIEEMAKEAAGVTANQCVVDCTSFDIQSFSVMCSNSKRKTQKSSNQLAPSCPPSCDLRIKFISLEQSMEDVNPKLQHLKSFAMDTETVFLF